MDVFEAIRTRRSVGKVKPERPAAEDVRKLLALATWAPNHHLTEPWRFHVIAGAAREDMGRTLEAALRASGETDPGKLEKERTKPLRAPVVIVVTSKPGQDEIETRENRAATAAAVQNILLGTHTMGLGAQWRTGETIYSTQLAAYLNLEPGEEVTAAIYVGYPDVPVKAGRRAKSVDDVTTWRGW